MEQLHAWPQTQKVPVSFCSFICTPTINAPESNYHYSYPHEYTLYKGSHQQDTLDRVYLKSERISDWVGD
jgi:hypothetical protein